MRRHDWYVPWLWHQCPAWEAWLVFVLMIVIFAAVLVAVVYLARVASPTGSDTASAASTESPRDTLERHYEAGEIDREEYQSHRRGRVRVSRPQCGYCQPGLRAAPTTQRSPMNILYTATAHVTGNGRRRGALEPPDIRPIWRSRGVGGSRGASGRLTTQEANPGPGTRDWGCQRRSW